MPVVLLSLDGSDNASGAIQKVSSSLSSLGGAMDQAQGKSAQYEAATLRNEAAFLRLSTAESRYGTLVQSNAAAVSRAASAQDAYQTALARQTSILSALSTGTISAASATGLLADANTRVSSTFDAFGSAADSAARSTQTLDSRLAALKNNQAAVITSQERLNTLLKDQPVPKDTTGGGSGGGGGHSYLLQAAGYTAAYAAYSAVSNSLGRDATYSRLLGSTAAMTGLSPAEAAKLDTLTTAQAASGAQPYNRTTLLQGDYSLASLGIGQDNASIINQVESIIAKGSAASGAADTSIIGDTLTTLIAAYGLNTSSVVANTQKLSDQLTIGIKLGKVDAPGFATAAGGPVANMAKGLGISTSDVISAIAAESVGGIATGQLGNDTYALLAGSARPTNPQRQEAQALGIDYNSSFWGKNGIAGGSDIIEQAMQRQGITGALQVPVLNKLLGQQDAANAFRALHAGNVQGFAPQVAASAGATNSAFTTSQSYTGAQLQDAETKLATGFDNMTTNALPTLVTALGGLTTGFNSAAALFSLFGKANSGDILMHYTDPLDKGFGNIKIATQEANKYGTSTPPSTENTSIPVVGGLMDANNWLSGKLSGLGGAIYQNVPGARAVGNQLNLSQTVSSTVPGLEPWQHPTGLPGVFNLGAPRQISANTPDQGTIGNSLAYFAPGTNTAHPDLSAAGRSYGGSPPDSYFGPTGANSPGYIASTLTGHGANPTSPDLTIAMNRITQAIEQGQSRNIVESALGLYRQVVTNNPLLTGAQRTIDINRATAPVTRYEQSLAGSPDQTAVSSAQSAYTLAQALGSTPIQLKAVFDQYLAAERQLVIDTTKPDSIARAKGLGAINQQATVFTAGQTNDVINRHLADLQNQVKIDTTLGNTSALAKDNAAVLTYQTAHAQYFKLDPSDLAVISANNQAALLAQNPVTNLHPFFQKQQGLGSFEAGEGSTLVRSGGVDPTMQEIRVLRAELAAANARADGYLAQIANNTRVTRGQAAGSTSAQRGGRGVSST